MREGGNLEQLQFGSPVSSLREAVRWTVSCLDERWTEGVGVDLGLVYTWVVCLPQWGKLTSGER